MHSEPPPRPAVPPAPPPRSHAARAAAARAAAPRRRCRRAPPDASAGRPRAAAAATPPRAARRAGIPHRRAPKPPPARARAACRPAAATAAGPGPAAADPPPPLPPAAVRRPRCAAASGRWRRPYRRCRQRPIPPSPPLPPSDCAQPTAASSAPNARGMRDTARSSRSCQYEPRLARNGPAGRYCVMNLMSSMRSSTVQVPVPPDELACHCSPTICVRVGIVEPAGLLNPENERGDGHRRRGRRRGDHVRRELVAVRGARAAARVGGRRRALILRLDLDLPGAAAEAARRDRGGELDGVEARRVRRTNRTMRPPPAYWPAVTVKFNFRLRAVASTAPCWSFPRPRRRTRCRPGRARRTTCRS